MVYREGKKKIHRVQGARITFVVKIKVWNSICMFEINIHKRWIIVFSILISGEGIIGF